MSIENIESHAIPHHDPSEEESLDAVVMRMKELFAPGETVVQKIDELYKGGDMEALDKLLDDATYEVLESNQEFMDNARKMRGSTAEEQVVIRDRQREIFDEARKMVALEAGLPTDEAGDTIQQVRQRIADRLAQLDDKENPGIDDVLKALGMIESDEDGKERFTYPEGLFLKSTDKKWKTYIESVLEYFRKERAVKMGTMARKDLEAIDGSRRIAHNAVAHGIDELLGLSALPATQWDFEKTRKLVTKMREKKYPTIDTAEREATNNALSASLMGLEALKVLNVRVATLSKDK